MLAQLLDRPEALEAEPQVVNRLQRLRASRLMQVPRMTAEEGERTHLNRLMTNAQDWGAA